MIIKVGVPPPLDISIINTAYVLKVRRKDLKKLFDWSYFDDTEARKRERIPILRAIQFD